MIRRTLQRFAPLVSGAVLVLLVLGMLHARLHAREVNQIIVPPAGSAYNLPHPGLARFTTLGYHEAAADLAWLRTIIYFGQQASVRGRFQDFERYVDLVIALDPNFRRIYHWAGVLMVYSRSQITREMVESSIHYLKMGVERFPDDGEMHYMLGFNLYFEYSVFLKDDPEAYREARLDGIQHFKRAIISGTGPPWLAPMVAGLMSKQGMDQLAIGSLQESLYVVEDEQVRKKILERIRQLESRVGEAGAARRWEAFRQEWNECCAYLDMDMFLLLRPRPVFRPEAAVEHLATTRDEALQMLDTMEVDQPPVSP